VIVNTVSSPIAYGSSAYFNIYVNNASSCSATGSWAYIIFADGIWTYGNHTNPLYTAGTNTFYFTCWNSYGTTTVPASVYVNSPPLGAFTEYTPSGSCLPLFDRPTVQLSWSGSSNATIYYIYQNGSLIGSTSGTSYSVAESTQLNGATVQYKIVASNSTGSTQGSPIVSFTMNCSGLYLQSTLAPSSASCSP
jgi:hypothetical protein